VIGWVIVAGLALLGVGGAVALLSHAREAVAAWLRRHSLGKVDLLGALLRLDKVAGTVRGKVFVNTRSTGLVLVDERTYRLDQIDDPELRQQVEARGFSERDVLHLVT